MKANVFYKKLKKLGNPSKINRMYKLKNMGIPLVSEYIKNIGVPVVKMDTHILRICGKIDLEY